MDSLGYSDINTHKDFTASTQEQIIGDYNPNTNINTNKIPVPNENVPKSLQFSSTSNVPLTSKLEESQNEIPSTYTDKIGPPLKPIHVREIYDKINNPNRGKRISELEVSQLVADPNSLLPGSKTNRLKELSDDANIKAKAENIKEKFYNITLSELGNNIVNTVVDIIDELWDYDWHTGLEGFIQIFVKKDRLIYLGMIVMFFSFLILMIRAVDNNNS